MAYTRGYKLSNIFDEVRLWLLSVLIAWGSGKVLLWPVLEIFLTWLKPGRTDVLSIDEMNLTLYEARMALTGVIFIALLLLATLAFDNRLDVRIKKIVIRTENIALAGYVYYYWLYQSVYWWYSSPIDINYFQAGLIREFNFIRAISVFCILVFATSKFVFGIIKDNSKMLILNQLIVQIFIYLVIWILYFWSSIPNRNLGLPATLIFSGIAISISIYYFRSNFGNNAQANEIA